MKYIKTLINKKHNFLLNSLLLILLAFYYLLFFNKGLVFYDEGLYVYTADLIMQGKQPYIDFFLEYQPGYFYVLAGLYKLFGPSVGVGRLLSLSICLGIFLATLALLKAYNLNSIKAKLTAFLSIASFGYPLITIPLLTWATVLLTLLLMLTLISLFKTVNKTNIILMGVLLALLFLTKQNIAATYTVIVNVLLFMGLQQSFKEKIKTIFSINFIWIGSTFIWVYYFFLRNNIAALFEFLDFNVRMPSIYPFSYPPLSLLFEPLGFIKLLPYYLPIVFLILLVIKIWKSKDKKIAVLLLPLVGFFTTIYPVSELLHVYPYFGLVLVSLFIFSSLYFTKVKKISFLVLFVCIISGFYLTLFREYYRYHPPYREQNTPLNLPRTKGIFIDKAKAEEVNAVYAFLNKHTKRDDYIFAYPFTSMQYFIFERQNPSRYPIYFPGYLTKEQERRTIKDIKEKKTKYIITDGAYKFSLPLSEWIVKQKKVEQFGQFVIYSVKP